MSEITVNVKIIYIELMRMQDVRPSHWHLEDCCEVNEKRKQNTTETEKIFISLVSSSESKWNGMFLKNEILIFKII